MEFKGKPKRLDFVFDTYNPPLYFVTFCTMHRRKLLDTEPVHAAFCDYAIEGSRRGVAVGRYVIMPDHIHLFVKGTVGLRLGEWVKGLKRCLYRAVIGVEPGETVWQPGYFEHIMRNSESFSKKWDYVVMNPVRQGLARDHKDWPYQGQIVAIDRV